MEPGAPNEPSILGADEFDARFAIMRDRLIRICTGFVGAATAEDVVHDTFLRARERRHQLRNDDLFEAWITRVAIRICLDRKASGKRLLDAMLRTRRRREPAPAMPGCGSSSRDSLRVSGRWWYSTTGMATASRRSPA